ncbi:hypothetical protein [Alteromonas lipolytica]|uniref:Uncharacterized protein n=1 Tax=Alteromonas lipolytica TaxID=1856405 RepID=A0A1E8FGV6_9ALTE|nr:hypothetical protein [Alteromonas lipolytica]OFI34693.1 hypothetical protein BFC17_14015 [Alteromonas lipolytica]GGF53217.1 hypothetical protein GCM10011338_01700 [Alteromonas lipolytica]
MKKQLTALVMLASMGWSASTLANNLQATQLQPVNTALVAIEISIDQPVLNIKSSIIDQVNETLQQTKNNGSVLLARENNLGLNQEATTRTE